MATYYYVRVSTKNQKEDRQMDAIPEGVPPENIFIEKESGKDFNRAVYRNMVARLQKGDLLLVKSLDRLGRNYSEIKEQWDILTRKIGADIRVQDMRLLDTTRDRDLLGMFLTDIVLEILSYVADNEWNSIHDRQAEGIAAAKQRGVKFGRPVKEIRGEHQEFVELWAAGEMTTAEAAGKCGMGVSTFRQRMREKKVSRKKKCRRSAKGKKT